MALTGKLVGDFASFYDAVNKAQVELKSFQSDAAKVGDSLNRMANSFSGKQVIQQATLMVDAVEKIGGASQLTEREFDRLQRTVQEAVAKMKAIGADVPQRMLDIANATKKIPPELSAVEKGFLDVKNAVSSFVGNFAANLVERGIGAIVNLGTAALDSAGQIDDLSKKLGISAEAVQGFQYAAEQSGTTIDTFGAAINKLNINLASGDKGTVAALDQLGLELADLRAAGGEEALLQIADAVAKIPDPMERARLMTELMGKSAVELLPAVADNLRKVADEAPKMSDKTVDSLAKAGDALDRLKRDAITTAGAVIGAFYNMGEAAVRYVHQLEDLLPKAKTKAQEFEDVADRIRKSQEVPDLPKAPGLPTLPSIGGQVKGPTPDEIARVTRMSNATAAAAAAQIKWNAARAGERQAIEDASQGMTYWLAGMQTVPAVVSSADSSLSSDFIPAMQLSTDAVMAFATQGKDSLTSFHKTLVSQNVSAVDSGRRLANFWTDELLPTVKDVFGGMQRYAADVFAAMLTGAEGFKSGFLAIWDGIRQSLTHILSEILNEFIGRFLKGLLGAIRGQQGAFASAFSGLFGGGGLGGLFGGGGKAAGDAAGGGGLAGLGKFLTNPWTIGIGGAAALIGSIWKGGLFRGGEEALKVNPARDQWFQSFVDKYGGQYSPYESLVRALEDAGVVGDKASRLIQDVYGSDTMEEFNAAVAKANEALEKTADVDKEAAPRNQTINVNPGAIVVNAANRDPYELAREIASALVDVIVRENPDGARTRLQNGLA